MNYKEKLETKEWIVRRGLILKRDKYKCTKCNSTKNLQVHHKAYSFDREPWEYTDNYLITLCKICHEKEHRDKSINSYFKENLPIYVLNKVTHIYEEKNNISPIFRFGKYKGLTFEEVHDLKYIDWYIKTVKLNKKRKKKNERDLHGFRKKNRQ